MFIVCRIQVQSQQQGHGRQLMLVQRCTRARSPTQPCGLSVILMYWSPQTPWMFLLLAIKHDFTKIQFVLYCHLYMEIYIHVQLHQCRITCDTLLSMVQVSQCLCILVLKPRQRIFIFCETESIYVALKLSLVFLSI